MKEPVMSTTKPFYIIGALSALVLVGLGLLAMLLVIVNSLQSGSQDIRQQATGPADWQNQDIKIRMTLVGYQGYNGQDRTRWPRVALYANNGQNFDGPYDYDSCVLAPTVATGLLSCGTPNLFTNRLLGEFEVGQGNVGPEPASYEMVTTRIVKAGQLIQATEITLATPYMTKLSFVYYNDHWNSGTGVDRNLAIKKVEFLASDDTVLLSFNPSQNSHYKGPGQGYNSAEKQSFYFDDGIVNIQGTQDVVQNGMNKAFDKSEVRGIYTSGSQTSGLWMMNQEGSFNIVTNQLYEKLMERLGVTPTVTPPLVATPTPSPVPATPTPSPVPATPSPTPGSCSNTPDLNCDGKVNLLDYQILLQSLNPLDV